MAIKKKAKQAIIAKNKIHDTDTGSSQVQAAILNARIKNLTEHLKDKKRGKNDTHSRRGLLDLVSRRRTHERNLAKKAKKRAGKK